MAAFAGRICEPDSFAMTCGIVVPVTLDLIEEVTLDTLAWWRGDPGQVAQDPRFAIAIHRAALNSGIMFRIILLRLICPGNRPGSCSALPIPPGGWHVLVCLDEAHVHHDIG